MKDGECSEKDGSTLSIGGRGVGSAARDDVTLTGCGTMTKARARDIMRRVGRGECRLEDVDAREIMAAAKVAAAALVRSIKATRAIKRKARARRERRIDVGVCQD